MTEKQQTIVIVGAVVAVLSSIFTAAIFNYNGEVKKIKQTKRQEKVFTQVRSFCGTEEDLTKVSKFIIQCTNAARPMNNDEDGEDLVEQCEKTAKSLCPKVVWVASEENKDYYSTYRPCTPPMEIDTKKLCIKAEALQKDDNSEENF